MNIACIACPARYAVPDGKIAGRKVRITCKRCGTPLIVDGTTDPPGVRGDVVRSQPPGSRYLLALTEVDREEADPGQVARLYATGKITAQTLAWKKGMSTWLTLFEIEELAHALKAAGFSQPKAELPPVPRIGGAFDDSEEEATRIVHSPLDEPEPPRPPPPPPVPEIGQTPIAELDEDEATTIFDTESLRSGAWSEPAAWADKLRDPRLPGEWREHGAVSDRQSPAQTAGAWEERGVEDDEVTRMVAPLEDQLQAMNAPISSRRLPPIPMPPAPTPAAGRRLSSRPPPPPPRRSSQPPSLPARDEDSGPRLAGQHSEVSGERVALDAIMGGGPPAGTLGGDIALLAPPAFPGVSKPEPKAPPALATETETEPAPPEKRRSGRWLLVILILVGGALVAARATGRWPLVEQTARDVWQKVNAIAR